MPTMDDKEKNLFNATETLGQFYDEIESFLDILYSNMERSGFSAKGERLRPGTQSITNLSRRLLGTATVIYVRGIAEPEDAMEEDESSEEEEFDTGKLGKEELPITSDLRIPFVHISLFDPKVIPTARTLASPSLCIGAIGDMSFVEKRSGEPASPDSPVMSLSNLANIRVKSTHKLGDRIRMNVWKPARMKKYKLLGKLVGFDKSRLLEVDSQEKIRALAEKLVAYSGATT